LIYLINGFKAHEVKEEINELIKKVDLVKYKNRKVSKLSGGQKQRVAIARALAQNTPIILADEPTGNLDSKASEEIMELLKLSNKKYNQTIIMITHNLDLASQADRVIKLEDGKIVEGE
jgi:putative ABC transport system ATP-binding protein